MTSRAIQSAAALALASVVTLALLGSVDYLARRDVQPPQLAQQATPQA